jgi:hypothetical protein
VPLKRLVKFQEEVSRTKKGKHFLSVWLMSAQKFQGTAQQIVEINP